MAYEINRDAIVWSRTASEPKPLVILMHGLGSHENDLAGLADFFPKSFATASLRAPRQEMGGYAWFPPGAHTSPDAGADMEAATTAVLDWIDNDIDPETPIVPLGFSQGGAMVSHLLRTRPDRFIGGVMLSGYIYPKPLPTDAEFQVAQLPIFIGRGDQDPIISNDHFENASNWLHDRSLLTEVVYNGMGHSVCHPEILNIAKFLEFTLTGENDAYAAFTQK